MKTVLVTGGAGYIGSHMVQVLKQRGYQAVVLDGLITGHRAAVGDVPFYQGDIADAKLIEQVVQKHDVEACIHFAARTLVVESVQQPDLYFEDNTAKTNRLLSALLKNGVNRIVFSSTAAVYGIPEATPIAETAPKRPINPYGLSKWMIEQSMEWLERAYGLNWIALRYFNACGASLDGSVGEHHEPETHLIPLVMQTALGQRAEMTVTGTDYATPDGTCIRDYVHVLDLADAHVRALEALERGATSRAYNIGTGTGYSVREIIEGARRVTGQAIPTVDRPRRPGDPDRLIAKVDDIKRDLGWTAQHSDLDTILQSAWNWHRQHPHGYGDGTAQS